MVIKFRATLLLFSLTLLLTSIPYAFADSAQKITLTGSSTVAPLLGEIAKRYEMSHPSVRIDVQTGGSSRGIADARRGLADIGMVSRSLKANESDLTAYPIAQDGICLIVHKDNPIKELSDEQVIKIYRGEIKNWKLVGGLDRPITVVNKAEGRSTLELFLKHFGIKNQEVEASVIIGDNEQGVKTVAGNPDALGYVSIGTAEYDASDGVPIKLLPVASVSASTQNVKNGTFPIARPLNLVVKSKPEGLISDFIAYASSESVRDLIEEQYFVPLQN